MPLGLHNIAPQLMAFVHAIAALLFVLLVVCVFAGLMWWLFDQLD